MLLHLVGAAVRVPSEELNAGMVAAVKAQFPSLAAYAVTAQVQLKLYQEKEFVVATDNYRLRYVLDRELTPKMQARITLYAADMPLRTVRVPFSVGVFAPVLYARQAGAVGDVLTENMTYLRETNVISSLDTVLYALHQVAGQHLTTAVRRDQLLQRWMFARAPVVSVGETITVLARTEDVELRIAAEVLQSGFLGDKIRVRLRPTKKVVWVRVNAPGEYEVQW